MKVDGREYTFNGRVECTHGSGDNREQWHFDVYEADDGTLRLANEDEGKSYFYLPIDREITYHEIDKTWESCPADSIRSSVGIDFNEAKLSWVSTCTRFRDAVAPFTLTKQAMIIADSKTRKTFLSVPILEHDQERFYSARCPDRAGPARSPVWLVSWILYFD